MKLIYPRKRIRLNTKNNCFTAKSKGQYVNIYRWTVLYRFIKKETSSDT